MRQLINVRAALISLLIVVVGFGGSTAAQQAPKVKLDKKLLDTMKNGKKGDMVGVILQSRSPLSLSAKVAKVGGKNANPFRYIQGMSVEVPVEVLSDLAADATIDAISSNEPVQTNSAADGSEPPNSSSGVLRERLRLSASLVLMEPESASPSSTAAWTLCPLSAISSTAWTSSITRPVDI
jgi:hypothetical protein